MSFVLFEKTGPIGKIILHHPDQLNAMNDSMGDELEALVPRINTDASIRSVILTGAGKAFCAGGNFQFIEERTQHTPEQNKQEMIRFYSKFLALRRIEVPTLAMINGPAIGAGFCLALACDLRVASEEAKMGVNFSKIGLSSGMGALYLLTQLAGPQGASDLLFTGRILSAKEAWELRLVNSLFPAPLLEHETLKIAETIARNAPIALKIMKKGISKALHASSLEEVFDYESSGQAKTFQTLDLLEGLQAIQEKRAPRFEGR